MSSDVLVVLSTMPPAAADRIAEALVGERLVACVSLVGPVRSIYRWDGAVQKDEELLAVMKTTAARADALIARLSELHPYEVPEIVALPVAAGLPAYLAWVAAETTPAR
jgi:periplasmic divalent cation tolerance protein